MAQGLGFVPLRKSKVGQQELHLGGKLRCRSGRFQQGSGLLELAQSELAARQSEHTPFIIFLLSGQFAKQRHRLCHPRCLDQRANQTHLVAAESVTDRLLNVLSGRSDIAEFNQLGDGLRGLGGVLTSLAAMQSGLVITHTLPTKDPFGLNLLAKHLQPRTSVHVTSHWQAEQRENRGGHIQNRRAVQTFVFLNVRSFQTGDAETAVAPLRVPFGLLRGRTAMPGFVTVVTHQNHVRLLIDVLEQRVEHHVVKPIAGSHDVLVQLKIQFRDPRHPRRMERHEFVAELVNGVEIDPH